MLFARAKGRLCQPTAGFDSVRVGYSCSLVACLTAGLFVPARPGSGADLRCQIV